MSAVGQAFRCPIGAMADEIKIPIHEWLQDLRDKVRMSQSEVDVKTRELGGRVSQGYLSQLEKGYKTLDKMEAGKMDALRRVYGVTTEEWAQRTGLTIVTPEAASAGVEQARAKKLEHAELPTGLRDAIDLYGPRFDDLNDPAWQQYLAGFNWRTGRPEEPERWLDLYRDLARAGVVPGGN